ncbi:MAG: hypothetical protein M3003_01125 [Candidatus Dormibacteraeota bacterium]|nr:hypothetical protein [Candidatus Dormibacteraeota bacterium]
MTECVHVDPFGPVALDVRLDPYELRAFGRRYIELNIGSRASGPLSDITDEDAHVHLTADQARHLGLSPFDAALRLGEST